MICNHVPTHSVMIELVERMNYNKTRLFVCTSVPLGWVWWALDANETYYPSCNNVAPRPTSLE